MHTDCLSLRAISCESCSVRQAASNGERRICGPNIHREYSARLRNSAFDGTSDAERIEIHRAIALPYVTIRRSWPFTPNPKTKVRVRARGCGCDVVEIGGTISGSEYDLLTAA
jgi:hypothetical protein